MKKLYQCSEKYARKELKQLRKDICLGSLYYSDYENHRNIDIHTLCDFFDGYLEELYCIAEQCGEKIKDFSDVVNKYDNIENLYNYYYGIENIAF